MNPFNRKQCPWALFLGRFHPCRLDGGFHAADILGGAAGFEAADNRFYISRGLWCLGLFDQRLRFPAVCNSSVMPPSGKPAIKLFLELDARRTELEQAQRRGDLA